MMKAACKQLFENVSAIITPTVPMTAPRVDELGKPWGRPGETALLWISRFTRFFNIIGLPAISIPCGFDREGLPIGMQIVGKAFDESGVLRVAHAYEQNTRWLDRRPDQNV
jgi:aspartyl-tRNA(Asn)/glutamyl-tRNA(Gln) amidotransferase subunit A